MQISREHQPPDFVKPQTCGLSVKEMQEEDIRIARGCLLASAVGLVGLCGTGIYAINNLDKIVEFIQVNLGK